MQPQNNKFNAGIWANMETQVRTWAGNFDTLFVCKGGTIDKSEWILKYLGSEKNKIPVPKYFFMAVLGKKGTSFKATGFWIAQDNYSSTSLKSYAVTIQNLQQKTGIDFFCNLPDDIENQVENVSQSKMESEWVWYD
jgi:endonuclease G